MLYYSQVKQDRFLNEKVFKNAKNKTFVDVGAHDGIVYSNTYFYYQTLGWRGINIEPIKRPYDQTVKARPEDINLNIAVSNKEGEEAFYQNEGCTECLSGLFKDMDSRHLDRIKFENRQGGKTNITMIKTKRLETILDDHNIKHVHYLSIDVEGGEKSVIDSINFDKVFIDVIDFENNYSDVSVPIVKYLESKGYINMNFPYGLDIMMIHKDSEFYQQYNLSK